VRAFAVILLAIGIVGALAASLDHVGVFDELAAVAARSRHVVGALWILAALVVALLNLDAAVVLLTPLYISTASLVDIDPVALAFQPVLVASLASGVLVVSNLTNLLAASQLSLHLPDPGRRDDRRTGGRRSHAGDRAGRGRALLGAPARGRSVRASRVDGGAGDRGRADRSHPPRSVAADPDRNRGARRRARRPRGRRRRPLAFTSLGAGGARGFAAGVVSANVLNNLPAVLVGLRHVSAPARVWPLLLGVNLGPMLLLTGSLAGLLWQASARRAGVEVDARRYSRVGVTVGVPAMVAAAVVLRLLG
jgi:arsenical pump membrane protein